MRGPARITSKVEFHFVAEAMKDFPKAFDHEIFLYLDAFAPQLLARERASVPIRKTPASKTDKWRKPGGLRSLLSTVIDPRALRLRSGLLTPAARSDGFYGYILDAGRGNRRTRSRPRTRLIANPKPGGKRFTIRYTRKISPIAPTRYDITFGRTRAWAQAQVGPFLLRAYDRALIKIGWAN